MMRWANFFHIYQPPRWAASTIRKVTRESYRPLVRILKLHPRIHLTLNIAGSLTEQLAALGYRNLLQDIRLLLRRGQIEITGTALYHPILPKLPSTEIRRQILLNTRINQKFFGADFHPRGIYFPEMAYGHAAATVSKKLGYRWMILDEIAYDGTLGRTQFTSHYRHARTGQSIILRNKIVSDYIAFSAPLRQPAAFWRHLEEDGRSDRVLVTAMDGETLGHHRPGADTLWQRLVTDPRVHAMTMTELLATLDRPRRLLPRPSSWSSRPTELRHHHPYLLWDDPTNPIHPLQWQLLNRVLRLVQRSSHAQARMLMDQTLASDQFWWASAKPWWSKKIVDAKVRELAAIAMLLQPPATWANRLADRIITLTSQWQTSGRYQRITQRYLASSPYEFVHYIGGKRITS
ncbi:MAG: hypothetical protein ACOYUK_05710 [Patescibacteria group bacterium]